MLPSLVEALSTLVPGVRTEVASALAEAMCGWPPLHIHQVSEAGFLAVLLQIPETVSVCNLDCIEIILNLGRAEMAARGGLPENPYAMMARECGGIALLEALRRHPVPSVLVRASRVDTSGRHSRSRLVRTLPVCE